MTFFASCADSYLACGTFSCVEFAEFPTEPWFTDFAYYPLWHMEEAELLEKIRQGDESEEEIVERANKLWKFYEKSHPK